MTEESYDPKQTALRSSGEFNTLRARDFQHEALKPIQSSTPSQVNEIKQTAGCYETEEDDGEPEVLER